MKPQNLGSAGTPPRCDGAWLPPPPRNTPLRRVYFRAEFDRFRSDNTSVIKSTLCRVITARKREHTFPLIFGIYMAVIGRPFRERLTVLLIECFGPRSAYVTHHFLINQIFLFQALGP